MKERRGPALEGGCLAADIGRVAVHEPRVTAVQVWSRATDGPSRALPAFLGQAGHSQSGRRGRPFWLDQPKDAREGGWHHAVVPGGALRRSRIPLLIRSQKAAEIS